jgi:hypothetical protein
VDVECDAAVVVDVGFEEEDDDVRGGTHSTGDQEARATALKVSVGGDPSQPLLPQHSQACVFWFHWIHVEASSAVREKLDQNEFLTLISDLRKGDTHSKKSDKRDHHKSHPCSRRRSTCCPSDRSSPGRIASFLCSIAALRLGWLWCCCRRTS